MTQFNYPRLLIAVCLACATLLDLHRQAIATQADSIHIPGLRTSGLAEHLRGLVLIEELNCAACHAAESTGLITAKKAPRLSHLAGRINPYYLQQFIQAPHHVKPGTTMPDVMGHLDATERKLAADSITQFLLSLDAAQSFQVTSIDAVAAEAGEKLFHTVGCVACHSPRDAQGNELLEESSVPLGKLEQKYNFASLVEFIKRPHSTRPSGRMPDLRLPTADIEKIASFLLNQTRLPGHLHYTLIRGRVWEGLDTNVEKVKSGLVDDFDLKNFNAVDKNCAIVFEGFLDIDNSGEYRFFLEFNGGQLLINGQEIVNLPPSNRRSVKTTEGTADLLRGWNRIEFTYVHTGSEPSLKFEMQGPEFSRQPIPASQLSISRTPIEPFRPFQLDEALIDTGREKFLELGCAACHDDVKVQPLQTARKSPQALSRLNVDGGCLSGESGSWPRFHLDSNQKNSLKAILPGLESLELTSQATVDKSMVTFNCIACHQRGELGGVSPERDHFFTGSRQELGNDGRIPPPLNLVGAKLQLDWLAAVILRGERQRPYLATKMPVFGEANVGPLIDLLPQVDLLEKVTFPPIGSEQAYKAAGRQLVGSQGFSCIACHDFNGQRATGPGALDIIHTTQRLKKDWFYLFMLEPNRFRRGTIMPSAWPGGHVFKTELLDADAKKQIESIWLYLEDGTRAKNPAGLSRQAAEIRVTDVAEICRGRGNAGYRGIAVGYPERLNVAFNSEEMSLRLLWKDEFVTVNNGSFQARGGERISFPEGIPFHRLKSMEDNWPYKRKTDFLFPQDHGYQFKGYFLDEKRRPTFMYRYGDINVEEYFEDRRDDDDHAYLLRRFVFDSPTPQLEFYFRAAAGKNVQELPHKDRRSFSMQQLIINIATDHRGEIRQGEEDELLIPLKCPAGKSTLELEYKW